MVGPFLEQRALHLERIPVAVVCGDGARAGMVEYQAPLVFGAAPVLQPARGRVAAGVEGPVLDPGLFPDLVDQSHARVERLARPAAREQEVGRVFAFRQRADDALGERRQRHQVDALALDPLVRLGPLVRDGPEGRALGVVQLAAASSVLRGASRMQSLT